MKKTLKMLSFLATASVFGGAYGYALPNEPEGCCPGATFAARGCETQCVTVGGYLSTNYLWAQVRDHLHLRRHDHHHHDHRRKHDHDHFNNFYMKAIRMFVRGELCNGWSGLISVDFAGRDHRALHWHSHDDHSHGSNDGHHHHHRHHFFMDRAYIEKAFCNAVFRAGYQKVNFGAEELVADECLKTINRSIATRYFLRLGHKAHSHTELEEHHKFHADHRFHENHFAGRHTGLYLSGDFLCNFHYHAEIVNGFSGLRHHSNRFNNEFGYFAGIAMDYELCGLDLLFGVHAGFQPQGARKSHDDGDHHHHHHHRHNRRGHVWGFDPYILANWNCFSFLGEFLWGHIESGSRRHKHHTANPWGVNIIPSYMINDCWELVARFSYLDTQHNGTSIDNAFGVVPHHAVNEITFNKAYAIAVGVNFFPIQSVKASLFYEYAKFKDALHHDGDHHDGHHHRFHRGHDNLNSVQAQLQLVF